MAHHPLPRRTSRHSVRQVTLGMALVGLFARAGIDTAIASRRDPGDRPPLAAWLAGSVTATTLQEALADDVLVLSLPFTAVADLARHRDDWSGKTVIDATNAYGVPPKVMAGRLSSDIVAQAMRGAAVVKAFNQLPAGLLARGPDQAATPAPIGQATPVPPSPQYPAGFFARYCW